MKKRVRIVLIVIVSVTLVLISLMLLFSSRKPEQELYIARAPSGQVYATGMVIKPGFIRGLLGDPGIQTGFWKIYHPDGITVKSCGEFDLNGEQCGEWRHYRANGSLEMIDHRRRNMQVGESVTYNEDGTVNNTAHFGNE